MDKLASLEDGNARAVEVAALLGDSVVGVKHCMDPRGGKVTAKTWGFAAGGLACLLASAAAFTASVSTASANDAALARHLADKKPAYAFRPDSTGAGTTALAFGGLALGLLGLTTALVRMRGEQKSPFYRIGTAPGVEQPVEQAPAADFPLVAPAGDDFVFNYGAGMDGELIVDGKVTPFAELAAAGYARPSATTAGALELPIPANARIRATAGKATFLVSAVARPRRQAVPLFASLEGRTAKYVAGSLAVHLGIWAILQQLPAEDTGISADLAATEVTTIGSASTEREDTPPEQDPDGGGGDPGAESTAAPMRLAEGAAGTPKSDRADGRLQIKDNQAPPQMTREQAIAAAREAGVLGSASVLRGGMVALTGEASFSSGFDGADVYGAVFGSDGEGHGNFGFGRRGFGPGGGCEIEPCGIVGVGRYGTIATGDKAGDGWRGGGGHGPLRKRTPGVPTVAITQPTGVTDGLDRAIIKRYVKRQIHKISYCYEHELLARPSLAGVVKVDFLITANGTVQTATGTGFDDTVARCVAGVVRGIEFPRTSTGGNVQVTYPFTFRAAGTQ